MLKKVKLQFYKIFNKQDTTPISKEERSLMIIASQLVNNKKTDLLMTPRMDKFYITSDDKSLFVVIDTELCDACVVNHVFGYHIKISQRAMNFILDKFIDEVEARRNAMENEFRSNIQYSLNSVAERLINNKKQ